MLLWFHPMIGDYERTAGRDHALPGRPRRHGAGAPAAGDRDLHLLGGLRGRAAAVGRFALIPFVVFYVPYVAFEGIALGVLGRQLNGLPADQRDAVAPGHGPELRQQPDLRRARPLLGPRLRSAWIVVIVSTAWPSAAPARRPALQVLLGASVLIGAHAPPLAPIGWACFAAAGWLVLRARHSSATEPTAPAAALAA